MNLGRDERGEEGKILRNLPFRRRLSIWKPAETPLRFTASGTTSERAFPGNMLNSKYTFLLHCVSKNIHKFSYILYVRDWYCTE
jgi:hypothetical protein